MQTSQEIKQTVKKTYGKIAARTQSGCACGCSTSSDAFFGDDYSKLQGYAPEADLGLGCGLPTEFAKLKPGDTVVDLGSGAGNDCFVARAVVGETGKVVGVDMTEEMVAKARKNADKFGYENVQFRLGEIEDLPLADNYADVVVSNCVLNLVPDKKRACNETFRVLKPGGHFSISDIVTSHELPEWLQEVAILYTGCVAGALTKTAYLENIYAAGFEKVQIQKEREIQVADELLQHYLTKAQMAEIKKLKLKIYSVTVYGEKPVNLN